jgi:hypothetical protein
MTQVKIEISDELFNRIDAEAAAVGLSADEYASCLINRVMPRASDPTEHGPALTPAADDREPKDG